MTPIDAHMERAARLEFAMLMLRIAVAMRVGMPADQTAAVPVKDGAL